MADAIHMSLKNGKGSSHVVGVADLRVVITCEGPEEWYAQGLDIDYLAQGTSLDGVKKAFESGLRKTVNENLKCVGSISRLLAPAPQDVWESYYHNVHFFSQVTTHEFKEVSCENGVRIMSTEHRSETCEHSLVNTTRGLPFAKISYLEPGI